MNGTLYIVSTPIGNLGDMSPRAIETLKAADFVAAEDTRVAMKLLSCFDIQKPIVSYYEHNKKQRGDEILARIQNGESCALTTDAGTPAISDPGGELVRQCMEAGVPVRTVPGCCAAAAAFSLSGLFETRFCFEGFLSVTKNVRRKHLESVKDEKRAMIFYEAPHKLKTTLEDFEKTFGPERKLLIARELTKLHEESFETTIGEAREKYAKEDPRGEFVLVVHGKPDSEDEPRSLEDPVVRAKELIAGGMRPADAAKQAAREMNMPKNAIYRALIEEQEEQE